MVWRDGPAPFNHAGAHRAGVGKDGLVSFRFGFGGNGNKIGSGVFVMRFAKGLARYKGIAQYMFHHFVTATVQPVQWLNFEQDMGLANFRKTKLSYQPSALLDKYRVRLRAD